MCMRCAANSGAQCRCVADGLATIACGLLESRQKDTWRDSSEFRPQGSVLDVLGVALRFTPALGHPNGRAFGARGRSARCPAAERRGFAVHPRWDAPNPSASTDSGSAALWIASFRRIAVARALARVRSAPAIPRSVLAFGCAPHAASAGPLQACALPQHMRRGGSTVQVQPVGT